MPWPHWATNATASAPSGPQTVPVLFRRWDQGLQCFLQTIFMLWGHCKALDHFNGLGHQRTWVIWVVFLTTRKGSGSNRVLTGFSTAVYGRSRLCILSFLSLPCWRLLLFLPCKTGLDNAPGMQLLFHPFGQQQRAHGHNTHVPLRETDPKVSRPLLLNPPPQSEKVGWGKWSVAKSSEIHLRNSSMGTYHG